MAGRCGLGAVAGSKRVKALVARGTHPVPLADKDAFKELKREALRLFKDSGFLNVIQGGGGRKGPLSPILRRQHHGVKFIR